MHLMSHLWEKEKKNWAKWAKNATQKGEANSEARSYGDRNNVVRVCELEAAMSCLRRNNAAIRPQARN